MTIAELKAMGWPDLSPETINQLNNARDIIQMLTDPVKEAEMKAKGWDTDKLRLECEKALTK